MSVASMSHDLRRAVPTTADADLPITQDYGRTDGERDKWQHLIDYVLLEWAEDRSQFSDEGVEPLTDEAITRAFEWAQRLRDAGRVAPDRVVPDPNGGIVFERQVGDLAEAIHVWDDGTVEYRRFHGTRLVKRETV